MDEVDPASANMEQLRSDLNEFMRNMWQIRWWGTFEELCVSSDEFPTEIRGWFYGQKEAETSPSTPVAEVDRVAFAECLREYGF